MVWWTSLLSWLKPNSWDTDESVMPICRQGTWWRGEGTQGRSIDCWKWDEGRGWGLKKEIDLYVMSVSLYFYLMVLWLHRIYQILSDWPITNRLLGTAYCLLKGVFLATCYAVPHSPRGMRSSHCDVLFSNPWQFGTVRVGSQFGTADNLASRTSWHHSIHRKISHQDNLGNQIKNYLEKLGHSLKLLMMYIQGAFSYYWI